MANILEIKNLTKVYQEGDSKIVVLDKVNLQVEKGKFIILVGPSGSGKSTLLNLIARLDKVSEGQIIFDGEDITKLKENNCAKLRLTKLGFVFQFDALLPEFTLLENVIMPSLVLGKPQKERAEKLLAKFDLLALKNKFPPSLSGGEKQRGALARALINKPLLLLADEPTGNLDGARKEQVFKDFAQATKDGTTIIMVTHDIHAAKYADKCYQIENHNLTSCKIEGINNKIIV